MDKLKKLYIEPTSKCNLECTMCFRNTWFDEKRADMPLDTFKRALDTMPDEVETIFFGGMGEPLFHSDIIEMIEVAASKAKHTELLTNATLLTGELSASLLEAGLTMLWVSIDSFSETEYEKIRLNSRYELIMEHIRQFNEERTKLERAVKLGIAFVVMKSNVGQLGLLPQFMTKNRVDEVNISNVFPTDAAAEREALYTRVFDLELGTENARSKVKIPYMDWSNQDVWAGMHALLENQDSTVYIADAPVKRRDRYCRFVEEGTAFVRHDGGVSPCMALLHNAVTSLCGQERRVFHHSFGNVNDQSLSGIWNSEEYSGFRDRVCRFDFSPCMHCGHCANALDNLGDCVGNEKPTCGACLWSEGLITCP